jgi:hypothetical protein
MFSESPVYVSEKHQVLRVKDQPTVPVGHIFASF